MDVTCAYDTKIQKEATTLCTQCCHVLTYLTINYHRFLVLEVNLPVTVQTLGIIPSGVLSGQGLL